MPLNSPRLLFVSTRPWPQIDPLVRAFRDAGFAVAAAHGGKRDKAPPQHGLRLYPASPAQLQATAEFAIRDVAPDLIVPTDAPAFHHLAALHARGAVAVAEPIARSLGSPDRIMRLIAPVALQRLARDHGLPVPNAVEIGQAAALRSLLDSVPLPVVLKSTRGAPQRSEVVRRPKAGLAAFHRLTGTGRVLPWLPERWGHGPTPGAIAVQQFIDGVGARHLVAARQGDVLAGVSLEPLAGEGPATVARILRHPVMAEVAATLVGLLDLSGLVGFDFILEHGSRQAWLVAVKPYASPIAHLAATGESGLAAALYRGFARGKNRPPPRRAGLLAATAASR
jgi:hypothetical protein